MIELDGFILDAQIKAGSGETVVLVGPNGAGKSLLLRAIAGLDPLQRGWIVIDGRAVDDPDCDQFVAPNQRGVGFVFSDGRLFQRSTVLANVAFGLQAQGKKRGLARAEAQAWLDRYELSALRDRRAATLSAGQAQRVALARALAVTPRLLLLDEPFAALDIATRGATRSALATTLTHHDGARIVVTHDPFEALTIADRVVVLEQGTVVQTGTVAELRQLPRSRYVAELLGRNVFSGEASNGRLRTSSGTELIVADLELQGSVIASIDPAAVAMHRSQPDTTARNCWEVVVARIDDDGGGRVRVRVQGAIELIVEITTAARVAFDLEVGSRCWVSVKATEISARTTPAPN